MRLNKQKTQKIIEASTILGMGGGGRYDSALAITDKLSAINVVTFEELMPDDIIVTAYGAGGLTKPANTKEVMSRGLALLQKQIKRPIQAIVPVEIGPYSLAAAFEIASKLGVPVVDGDLVGFRSVPEIFIELVTLADLTRCPLVFGNNENDLVLLESCNNAERLEQIVRAFADSSMSNTFVFGYPFTKEQLGNCLAPNSISYCLALESNLTTDFECIGTGLVVEDRKQETSGFTQGYLTVQNTETTFRIDFKNEYLVLLKNGNIIVTCPDFICVIDKKTGLGLNNGDMNKGKAVAIYVRAAIKQWRTPEGLALFSPKNLGLDYSQKVLE